MKTPEQEREREKEPLVHIPRSAQTWVGRDINGKEVPYSDVHDLIHKDVSMGNEYRRERIKHLVTLAAGVFALTVTFHKDLFHERLTATTICMLFGGWALLLLSLLFGIVHLRAWEDFYLSYRDIGSAVWKHYAADGEDAKIQANVEFNHALTKRGRGKRAFRLYDNIQTSTLLLGFACIALYVFCSATSLDGRNSSSPKPMTNVNRMPGPVLPAR